MNHHVICIGWQQAGKQGSRIRPFRGPFAARDLQPATSNSKSSFTTCILSKPFFEAYLQKYTGQNAH